MTTHINIPGLISYDRLLMSETNLLSQKLLKSYKSFNVCQLRALFSPFPKPKCNGFCNEELEKKKGDREMSG